MPSPDGPDRLGRVVGRAESDRLDRWLDGLVDASVGPDPAADLDPSWYETVRALGRLDDAPAVDSAFAATLWEGLMAHATTVDSMPFGSRLPATDRRRSPRSFPFVPARRRWWPPLELAAACLLILALLGLALGWGRDMRLGVAPFDDEDPTAPPASIGATLPPATASVQADEDDAIGTITPPVKLWREQLRLFGDAQPAVADGLVVVSTEGEVRAFDAVDGSERWRAPIITGQPQPGAPGLSEPIAADGTVYVGSSFGWLFAIDLATGDRRWQTEFEGQSVSAAVVVDDLAVVIEERLVETDEGTLTTEVFLAAVDVRTGDAGWSVPIGVPPVGGVVFDGTSFIVGSVEGVRALDANGDERWFFALPGTLGPPVVLGDRVFATAPPDVVAIDAATGSEQWRQQLVAISPAVIAGSGGTLYLFGDAEGGLSLIAVDGATQAVRWSVPLDPVAAPRARDLDLEVASLRTPTVAGETVYVVNFGADVVAFDAATGEERWRAEVAGTPIAPPIVADGIVYVVTESGALTALGSPPAAFAPTHHSATRSALILRAEPGPNADIVTVLPPGTPLRHLGDSTTLDTTATWLLFETADGQAGWIREIDVEPVPVTLATPAP